MWNLIKGNLTKRSVRLEGEALSLNINYRKKCQSQPLTEESSTFRNDRLQASTGIDAHWIFHKKSTTPVNQPMKKCYHPELLLFSNGFSLKTTALNFLLHKTMFLFFVVLPMVWMDLHALVAILLFPNKPISVGKIAFIMKSFMCLASDLVVQKVVALQYFCFWAHWQSFPAPLQLMSLRD